MSEDHLGALPRGFRLHEYRIERVLGHGGFGITYLAWDTHLDKSVAIKEYIPSDFAVRSAGVSVRPKSAGAQQNYAWGLERFIQEAQTLARFRHRNIISVLRFFEENGTAYMVMEYEDGESLAQRLDRRRRLSEQELASILFPLLDGLEEIHRVGVLHRDIKPGNIYIRSDGTPVLIDFGAARQAVGNRSKSLTALVSVGYSPYEQYTAKAEQGAFTDIYSLAAVCYHAITARPPPDAPDRMRKDDMVPAVVAGRGHFDPAFLAALDRGLAVDEEDRPQSISAWRQMLEGARPAIALRVDAEPITLNTGEDPQGDGTAGQRRSGVAVAIALLVLIASGGAGLYAYQQNLDKQALEQALVAERQTAEARQREALAEAERRAEESRQEAARIAREKAEAEAAAKRKSEEAKRLAAEKARHRAEEKRRTDEAARRKAEAAARRKAEEAVAKAEAQRRSEESARRKAEEAARQAEAKRQAEQKARRRAEEESRRAEAERQAREVARRQAAEEARRKAEAEAARAAQEQARRETEAAAEKERRAQAQTASRTQTGSYGGTKIAAQSCVPGSRRLLDVHIERGSSNRRRDFSNATCRDPSLFVDDVKRVGPKLRWSVPLVKSTVSCECTRPGATAASQPPRRQGNAVTGTRISAEWCRPGSKRLVTSRVERGSAWRKSDFSNQDCRKPDYYVRDIRRSGGTLFWSVPFTKAAIDCSCRQPAGTTSQRTASSAYNGDRIKSNWCVPGSQRLTGKNVAPSSSVRAGQFSDRDCRNPSYTVRGLRAAGSQLQWDVPFVGANISCACARK